MFPCYFCVDFQVEGLFGNARRATTSWEYSFSSDGERSGWPAWKSDPSAVQDLFELAADFSQQGFRYRDCQKLRCDTIVGAVRARANGDIISVSGSPSSIARRDSCTQQWLCEAPLSVASLESFTHSVKSSSDLAISPSVQGSEFTTVNVAAAMNAQSQEIWIF